MALYEGNIGEYPLQRTHVLELWLFLCCTPNKLLNNKSSRCEYKWYGAHVTSLYFLGITKSL